MHNPFSATHIHNVKFLKSYIKSVDSTLSHLGRVLGADIHGLDSSLNKIGGKYKKSSATTAKRSSTIDNNLYTALLGKYTTNSRLSRGQIFTDIASSISKAMRRDM